MDDTSEATRPPTSLDKVLAALAALGEATAASISEQAGIGYSTTTPKLRELESDGRAERLRADTGRVLWRLTTTGAGQPGGDARQPTATDGEAVTHAAAAPTQTAGPGETAGPDTDPGDREPDDSPPYPAPHIGEATAAAESGARASGSTGHQEPQARAAASAHTGEAPADGGKGRRGPANSKRPKGALRGAVLALLRNNPEAAYKVGEICRLLDRAAEGARVNKASAGAVANALDKLVVDGTVRQVGDKPATFQAA